MCAWGISYAGQVSSFKSLEGREERESTTDVTLAMVTDGNLQKQKTANPRHDTVD